MTTDQLRALYLDFFKSKAHKYYSSDSLIPAADPSVLFTGAGMNQFKPYFLGLKKDVKRATSCQKCLRTADLDRVGKTAYHHSFFEMLGNFSFGDYFKEEAIRFAWEFVTEKLKLSKDNLWVSVYQEDDEAFAIWKDKIGLDPARIVRMGPEDNFWPANAPKDGPNGPCGPCSEIYVGKTPGKGVEIWNLVFTQYDRQSDGSLVDLPQKNIDTGMGLERAASVIQGVESNFDIDLFKKIRLGLRTLLERKDPFDISRENAAMDHARAATFTIADGAAPSNEGRGYVTRKLIRLGSDHLEKAGAAPGRFHELVPLVIDAMKIGYPELVARQKELTLAVENEEKAYLKILARDIPRGGAGWEEYAFLLYDTHGLPVDAIKKKFSDQGQVFNEAKFSEYLEEQRTRSRQGSKLAGEIFTRNDLYALIEGLAPTRFEGYEGDAGEGKLVRAIQNKKIVEELKEGDEALLIFDRTPFYAESGGQIGDAGSVKSRDFSAKVIDTQVLEKCVLHQVQVERGKAVTGKSYRLQVDADRRLDVMKNHTATHLLHSALRRVLGTHVKQSGSLVARDYLRFDFTHPSAVGGEALAKIEALVNDQVQKNTPLSKKVMGKEEALQAGAIAFFGEKYGEEVRVVSVGNFSTELCGGTHLASTGQIGIFKIISESSIQAGVRRIEAVTGRAAQAYVAGQEKELGDILKNFGSTKEGIRPELKKKSECVSGLKNHLTQLVGDRIKKRLEAGLSESPEKDGVKLVVMTLDGASAEVIKPAADFIKTLPGKRAMILSSRCDDKVTLAVAGSGDFVRQGFNAGEIIRKITQVVDGKGGGRPEFAIGGGKNINRISEALEMGKKEICK